MIRKKYVILKKITVHERKKMYVDLVDDLLDIISEKKADLDLFLHLTSHVSTLYLSDVIYA